MRVLVIAPHPDDETLGCGGTLLKHVAGGDSVSWVIVTKAYEPRWPKDVIERRERQIEQVSEAYGFANRFRLTFPAARLDTIPLEDLLAAINEIVTKVKPDWMGAKFVLVSAVRNGRLPNMWQMEFVDHVT